MGAPSPPQPTPPAAVDPPLLRIEGLVFFDEARGAWFAQTKLFIRGEVKESQTWEGVPFKSQRRAKQFARALASRQAELVRQSAVRQLIAIGVLPE